MPFIIAGSLSQRHIPLGTFERFAFDGETQSKILSDLLGCTTLSEAVILSTCQRTELVVVADRFHTGIEQLRDVISRYSGVDSVTVGEYLQIAVDESALRHLFRVSAGADSAVLGEVEILGQVQTSWELARNEGATGMLLDALFGAAVALGRKVRSTTLIAQGPTSLSYVAADLALSSSEIAPGPATVVVVGAGEMALGVIRSLPADTTVLVVNRSDSRVRQLEIDLRETPSATKRAVPTIQHVSTQVATQAIAAGVDAIVSTVPASVDWLEVEALSMGANARDGRTSAIVDLAVPRSISLESPVDGVLVHDIEAVTSHVHATYAQRQNELPAVLEQIEVAIESFLHGIDQREVEPFIKELVEYVDQIRLAQLSRNASLLESLPESARQQVESMMRAFQAKILHEPLVQLRGRSGTDHGRRMATELRKAFDL